jgi:hypothetical protein
LHRTGRERITVVEIFLEKRMSEERFVLGDIQSEDLSQGVSPVVVVTPRTLKPAFAKSDCISPAVTAGSCSTVTIEVTTLGETRRI